MQEKVNKGFKILLFLMVTFIVSCGLERKVNNEMKNKNFTSCDSFDCLEKNKNTAAIIKGKLRPYTPNQRGKGTGYMFWDWEVLLADEIAIPVVCEDKRINLSAYNSKDILIEGNIFYGIIIGSPEGQNATGYRIDINSIQKQTTQHKK